MLLCMQDQLKESELLQGRPGMFAISQVSATGGKMLGGGQEIMKRYCNEHSGTISTSFVFLFNTFLTPSNVELICPLACGPLLQDKVPRRTGGIGC